MTDTRRNIVILMAEDDPDDRMLAEEAFEEARVRNDLRFVGDGEELLAYLRREGRYADRSTSPRPGLILLDLNMPKLDGREALREIKQDPNLRRIPIVVLTTSKSEIDLLQSYDLGANSYIVKPVTFDRLVEIIADLGRYWIEIVELPRDADE